MDATDPRMQPPPKPAQVMYPLRDREFPRHYVLLLDVSAGLADEKKWVLGAGGTTGASMGQRGVGGDRTGRKGGERGEGRERRAQPTDGPHNQPRTQTGHWTTWWPPAHNQIDWPAETLPTDQPKQLAEPHAGRWTLRHPPTPTHAHTNQSASLETTSQRTN